MTGSHRYRKVRLGSTGVGVLREADGRVRMRAAQPLAAYPSRLTERLVKWAAECPERVFVAKRAASGAWRTISYGAALQAARSIGQALLDRGLCA